MYRYEMSQTFIAVDSESAMSSMSKAYFNSQKLYNTRVTIIWEIEMFFATSSLREFRIVTEVAFGDKLRCENKRTAADVHQSREALKIAILQ